MDDVATQVSAYLEGLGATAEQVAANLKAGQIQGARNTVRMRNPIVRFLQKTLLIGSLNAELTGPDTLRITLGAGRTEKSALPQAVREFLAAFDRGAYRELEITS